MDNNIHDIGSAHNGNKNQPQQVNINLDETDPVVCTVEGCESETFIEAKRMRRISAAHPKNPTKSARAILFDTMVCSQCGTEISGGE